MKPQRGAPSFPADPSLEAREDEATRLLPAGREAQGPRGKPRHAIADEKSKRGPKAKGLANDADDGGTWCGPQVVPPPSEAMVGLVFMTGLAALVGSAPYAPLARLYKLLGVPDAENLPIPRHAPTQAANFGAAVLTGYVVGFIVLLLMCRGFTPLQNVFRLLLCIEYATWAPTVMPTTNDQLRFLANAAVLVTASWDVVVVVKGITGVHPLWLRHGFAVCPFTGRTDIPEAKFSAHLEQCTKDKEEQGEGPSWVSSGVDEDSRNFFSRYTFTWLSDLVRFAGAMPGYLADRRHYFAVPKLPRASEAGQVREREVWPKFVAWRMQRAAARVAEAAKAGQPLHGPVSLTGPTVATFFFLRTAAGRRFLYIIPVKMVQDILGIVVGPLFINRLIRYARADEDDLSTEGDAWYGLRILALALIGLSTQAVLFQVYLYHLYRVSLDAGTTVRAMLHTAATEAPMYARSGYGHGDVIAMATVDAHRIGDGITFLHNAWGHPLMILVCIGLLSTYVGIFAAGAALAALVGLAYVNRRVIAIASIAQAASAAATSSRSSDTSDALQCIRAVKFTGWESTVLRSLMEARDGEATAEGRAIRYRGLTTLSSEFGTAIAYVACFVAYYLTGGDFDSARLVPAVAILNSLRFPVWSFPSNMASILRASSSAARVGSFLANVAESYQHRRVRLVETPETQAATDGAAGATPASMDVAGDEREALSTPPSTRDSTGPGGKPPHLAPFGTFTASDSPLAARTLSDMPPAAVASRSPAASPSAPSRGKASRVGAVVCEAQTAVAPHPAAAFQLDCTVDQREPFSVPAGSLVYIAGPNASGKSTFLRALAGEASVTSGDISIVGAKKVAYLPQTPWIFNGTVRDNILAGLPLDRPRYQRVLAATALNEDLACWDLSDMFDVGNAGASLSGGQRARVALARACYADADVYLLDDVLSALDESIQSHVARRCILLLLSGKTRIFTSFGDPNSGAVSPAYAELGKGAFLSLLVNPNGSGFTTNERASGQLRAYVSATYDSRSTTPSTTRSRTPSTPKSLGKRPRRVEAPSFNDPSTKEALLEARRRFGVAAGALVVLLSVCAQATLTSMDASVGAWSSGRSNSALTVLRALVVLGFLGATLSAARVLTFFLQSLRASTSLHKAAVERVVHASLAWVEAPARIGAITAVLTKDQDVVDHAVPESVEALWASTLKLVVVCLFNGLISPSLLVLLLPMGTCFYHVTLKYLDAARDMRRLEAVVKNDAVVCLANALRGGAVARGLSAHGKLADEHDEALDAMNAATNSGYVLARWVGLRLEFVAVTLTMCVAALAVASRGHVQAAFAGIAVANCLATTRTMLMLCRRIGMIQSESASLEQLVMLHASVPAPVAKKEPKSVASGTHAPASRAVVHIPGIPPLDMPSPMTQQHPSPPVVPTTSIGWSDAVGGIYPPTLSPPLMAAAASRMPRSNEPCALLFDRVAVRYPGQQYDTVSDVSFRVGHGEQVGLVGRTGAGKSTLVSALLGHATVSSGHIDLLGRRIADGESQSTEEELGGGGLPESLRHLVGVVPQDPMLMPRLSWRQHLVAAGSYCPDGVLRGALQSVGLARLVTRTLDDTLEASGAHLSPAQAQLLSFARVLCMQSVKLIILDEPSATVDSGTEATMVVALRRLPGRPAVLVIAHSGLMLQECHRVVDLTATVDDPTPMGSLEPRSMLSFSA